MYCLGLGGSNHDYSACVTFEDTPLVAIEEERLTRQKYSVGVDALFTKSRAYCLDHANIKMGDLSAIVADDTLLPSVYFTFRDRTTIIRHHFAHAASTFFPSPFQRAAILVADGAGSLIDPDIGVETLTYALGEGAKIEEIGKVFGTNWATDNLSRRHTYQVGDSDHSLGYLYKAVSHAIGFVFKQSGDWYVTEDGKTMGLAPYGSNRYYNQFRQFLELRLDGTFQLHLKNGGLIDWVHRTVDEGPEEERFERAADLAWAAQAMIEDTLSHCANYLHSQTRCDNLCLAGGVALNCVANGVVFSRTPFKNIFIQPAAGDAGNAIGCALFGYHGVMNRPRYR